MLPARSAAHNCSGVGGAFFGCCTCPEEGCAFEAAGACATTGWVVTSFTPRGGSSFVLGFVLGGELATRSPGFAVCGVADGDDVRVIRFEEDAPAKGGVCFLF